MKRTGAYLHAQDLLKQCGSIMLRPSPSESDEDAALWFARSTVGVIDANRLTKSEVRDLVRGCYSQYVRATNLKPQIDAKPFITEVLKQIEINRHAGTRQREELAWIREQRRQYEAMSER